MAILPLDLTLIQALLTSKTVDAGTNKDDLTTPGFYYVNEANWGHLIVTANDSKNRIAQISLPDYRDSAWFRVKNDSGWGQWKQLATMDQVTNELTHLLTTVEF